VPKTKSLRDTATPLRRSAKAKPAPLSRALNHEGDKGRTQVKRALVTQTGIKYGAVNKAMATIRATPATLTYALKVRGDETNIAWFGGVQRRKGVSAAPWHKRRIFRHSFIVPRFGACLHPDPEKWPADLAVRMERGRKPSLLLYRVVCVDEDTTLWPACDIGNLRLALNTLVRAFDMTS
jgi:hypothetical protein